jgi:CheY-like chemotaxis protein
MSAPVVVIDDSEIGRAELSRILKDAGLQVIAIPSAIGATQVILRHQARVVVANVSMPTIRGDRLLALFRKNPRLGHLSVVLVSGQSEDELVRLRTETQADAVVSKSNLEGLPAIVKDLVNKERRDE